MLGLKAHATMSSFIHIFKAVSGPRLKRLLSESALGGLIIKLACGREEKQFSSGISLVLVLLHATALGAAWW